MKLHVTIYLFQNKDLKIVLNLYSFNFSFIFKWRNYYIQIYQNTIVSIYLLLLNVLNPNVNNWIVFNCIQLLIPWTSNNQFALINLDWRLQLDLEKEQNFCLSVEDFLCNRLYLISIFSSWWDDSFYHISISFYWKFNTII